MRKSTVQIGIGIFPMILLVFYFGISYVIASGVTKADRIDQEAIPEDFNLTYENISFISRKGDVTLHGWYILGQAEAPSIVFVHGINGVRSGNNAVEISALLVDRGFNTLLFDQRAHGSSGGTQTSYGYHERLDVLGAIDYLQTNGIPKKNIGVIGFSMGAGTALLGAAEEPELKALVADSPYASASDLIVEEVAERTSFPTWFVPVFVPGTKFVAQLLFRIDVEAMTPEKAVSDLKYPVLVIHGMDDTRVPVEHGIRVHAATQNTQSELWLIPGTEHNDAFLNYPKEYESRIAEYFARRLNACNIIARVTC